MALAALGYSRSFSFPNATETGVIEAIGGLFGVGVAAVSVWVLPFGLGFAAGAMLFIISHEIIPETHRTGHEKLATSGLMVGVVVMTFLDTALK